MQDGENLGHDHSQRHRLRPESCLRDPRSDGREVVVGEVRTPAHDGGTGVSGLQDGSDALVVDTEEPRQLSGWDLTRLVVLVDEVLGEEDLTMVRGDGPESFVVGKPPENCLPFGLRPFRVNRTRLLDRGGGK